MSIESITEALNEHEACESNPLNISFEECDNPKCLSARSRSPKSKRRGPPLRERMETKTQRSDDGCWLWIGAKQSAGYGTVWDAGVNRLAHRVAYELDVGPIPPGLTLDHLCRNRRCVNPAHLEVVTFAENVRRGISPPAQHARQTHCKHGHEFTPENTYLRARSYGGYSRRCRTCQKRIDDARDRKTEGWYLQRHGKPLACRAAQEELAAEVAA